MRHLLSGLVIIFTLGTVLASCGGDDSPSAAPTTTGKNAGDTAVALLQMVDKGQWGPEWDALHPAQQALITRDAYITCANAKGSIPALSNISVMQTYPETITIPGTSVSSASTAVTLQYTGSAGGQSTTTKSTFHMFNIDGQWRWVMADPATCK